MSAIRTALVLFVLISSAVAYATPASPSPTSTRFTAVVLSGRHFFAGTLTTRNGMEPESGFLKVEADTGKRMKIELPSDLRDREIVAMFPTKTGLYVVTQYTIEQGDKPLVHHFTSASGVWKSVGEINCPAFAMIRSAKNALIFECEELTDTGKTLPKKKKLTLLKKIEAPVRELKLPQIHDKANGREVKLLGAPFEWDSVKVKSGSKEKDYGVAELAPSSR